MTVLIKALVTVLLFAMAAVCAQDFQRGLRNYQDIMAGRKRLEQLSPQERNEVVQVHRLMQARDGGSGKSQECREATDRARYAASELADYARRLRNCAESQNFSDDCSSELRRTRNAHGDYESAVSQVGSSCS